MPPSRKSRVGDQGGEEIFVGQQGLPRVLLRGWVRGGTAERWSCLSNAQGHMRGGKRHLETCWLEMWTRGLRSLNGSMTGLWFLRG